MTTPRQAAQAWVRALNQKGPPAAIHTLFTPRAVVLRFIADEPESQPERIAGHGGIARWVSLSPGKARFSLVPRSLSRLDDGRVEVGYRVKVGEFENFGRWTLTFAEDGRIRRLEHRPQPVPARWRL